MMVCCVNSWELFNPNELEEGGQTFVNPDEGVNDIHHNLRMSGNFVNKYDD